MKEENTYNEQGGSNLPDYLRVNPFGIPEGYFGTLENSILGKVAEQKLKDSVSDTGFGVPEGYFEDGASTILSRIAEQKLKDKVTADGYEVPTGYFESLSDRIIHKVTAQPTVLRLPKRSWIRYTAAAAVAIFLGISSYWYIDSGNTNLNEGQNTQASLGEISNDEIVNYLAQVTDGVELIELATYLNNEETTESSFEIDQQLNDKEIEEYLNYML